MHRGFLTVQHLHHLPVVGDIVLNRRDRAGVSYDHDRHAGKEQGFDQDPDALIGAGCDLIDIVDQLADSVHNDLAAGRAVGLIIDDIADDPVGFRDIFAENVADAGAYHLDRSGLKNVDVTDNDLGALAGAVDLDAAESQRADRGSVAVHGRSGADADLRNAETGRDHTGRIRDGTGADGDKEFRIRLQAQHDLADRGLVRIHRTVSADNAGVDGNTAGLEQIRCAASGQIPGDIVRDQNAVRTDAAELNVFRNIVENPVADVDVLLRFIVLARAIAFDIGNDQLAVFIIIHLITHMVTPSFY